MILRNTFALLLAVTLTAPLFAQDRFIPASDSDPVMGRYLVLFAGDDPAADESTADAIARTYGARIEPYADSSVRGALMHMRPAQARLLSEDLRVLRVEEQPLSGDAAPRAPQPASAAPARRAPVADASFSPITTAETPIWSSGTYVYDDAGNIRAIGSDNYRYDGVGRLVYATAFTPGNANNIQSYGYDEFGNMTLRVTDPHGSFPNAESYPVNAATNQLTSAQYDDTGNQIAIEPNGGVLAYDAAGMLTALTAGNNKLAYVYDANDERVVTIELVNGNESRHRYTLRGSDNKIARELTLEPLTMNWHLVKDYVHRGSALMASFSSPTATAPDRHYHLDHLGSTRLVTDASGNAVATMTYYPFGLEAPGSTPTPGDRLKFTGHERDTDGAAAAFNLDYMHARYYNGATSRFAAGDPEPDSVDIQAPQSWNRYSYVWNNPVANIDPDGRCTIRLADGSTHTDDSVICIEVTAKEPHWSPAEMIARQHAEVERQKAEFMEQVSKIPMVGSSLNIKFDGPSISKHGHGRLFQIRYGDPKKPTMIRLDINSKGLLEANYQQQGKGKRGFNKHIPMDPRNLVPRGLVPPRPFMPIINPCMLNPTLCDPYGTDV